MHEQGNDETPTFARIFSLGEPPSPPRLRLRFLLRWSVALRPTLLVTDTQTRQLRTVIILIPGHGDTDTKSHALGVAMAVFCHWLAWEVATIYTFWTTGKISQLWCNYHYQVPPSIDRAGTHT